MNQPLINIKILSLFPEIFPGPLGISLSGQALKKNIWNLEAHNLRNYSQDKHKTVDDTPYGGGEGMVIKPDILSRAIDDLKGDARIIYPSPRGRLLNQKYVRELSLEKDLLFICGRFEGIDQRIIDHYNLEEVSIGDYVLSGGEIAALAIIDSIIRLLPNVINNDLATYEESFGSSPEFNNLLEYPLYTKPAIWNNIAVPEVLTSGDHKKIKEWRKKQALEITKKRRPDLLK